MGIVACGYGRAEPYMCEDQPLIGDGFQIHNPNAASSCGCGKSFGERSRSSCIARRLSRLPDRSLLQNCMDSTACLSHSQDRASASMQIAKQLADCVIPNEYGIDAGSKMRIGSKICCALLGKLLADLSNMQEESIATAVSLQAPHPG